MQITLETAFAPVTQTCATVETDTVQLSRLKSIAAMSTSVLKAADALTHGSKGILLGSLLLAKRKLAATTRCMYLE